MLHGFFDIFIGLPDPILDRILPRRPLQPGLVKSAELPSSVTAAVMVALEAGQDAAVLLPPGWRGYRTGLDNQADAETVGKTAIGVALPLTVEPDEDRNRDPVRVGNLGYLPSTDEMAGALRRGWVQCWLADRQPTARYPSGATIVFVAVYDPA